MAGLTLEEKQQRIENVVRRLKEQNRKFLLVKEFVDICKNELGLGDLSGQIKQVFNVGAREYLEEQGLLYSVNEIVNLSWNTLERIKKELTDRSPAKTMAELKDMVKLSEYEEKCMLLQTAWFKNLVAGKHDPEPSIEDYYNAGILEKIVKSDEDKKKLLTQIIERMEGNSFLLIYDAKRLFDSKCEEVVRECFNADVELSNKEMDYHIRMFMEGIDKEDLLISHGFAFSEEEAKKVAEERLLKLKELCPKPVADIAAFVANNNIPINLDELYSFYSSEWNLFERYLGERKDSKTLFFIDEGLQKGTPSKYKKKLDESMKNANGKSAGTKGQNTFSIYSKLDKIDLLGFANDSGYGPDEKCFQKNVNAKVEVNGITFAIKTKFAKNKWLTNCNGIDGVKAIETMLSSSEVQERFFKNDPNARTNPEVVPEFSIRNIGSFPERAMFIRTVAAKIMEPDVMSKLVEFVPKKKDGTLAKNRVTRIASSMIGIFPNYVVELAGRAKDDTTLVITLEEERVKPDSLEVSANDFINNNKELIGIDKYIKNE